VRHSRWRRREQVDFVCFLAVAEFTAPQTLRCFAPSFFVMSIR